MIEFIFPQLITTFGKEIFNNIMVIFTFCDENKNIYCFETLKNKDSYFYKCFGDINTIIPLAIRTEQKIFLKKFSKIRISRRRILKFKILCQIRQKL